MRSTRKDFSYSIIADVDDQVSVPLVANNSNLDLKFFTERALFTMADIKIKNTVSVDTKDNFVQILDSSRLFC